MKDWRSQSHVKWDCKYHVVIVPKYRRRKFYGSLRGEIGKILRDLCRQQEIELVKGNALPDHVHLLLSVPPKHSVANLLAF
jgi:putative transposase